MKNLYHVQSGDENESMYVVATSWQDAIKKWKKRLMKEHNDSQETRQVARFWDFKDMEEPIGVNFVAYGTELIL